GHQRALGHVLAVVDRRTRTDAGEQLIVLALEHVVRAILARGRPGVGALDATAHLLIAVAQGRRAARAHHEIGDVVGAVGLLAAHAKALDAVGKFVGDRHVVVNVAELTARADLAAARAVTAFRVLVAHHPAHLVQAVDVLLDVEVAGQPGEIQPIPQLPLHVAPALLARPVPQRAGVVGTLQSNNVADGVVVDPPDDLPHAGVVTPAQPRNDRQPVLAGLRAGSEHRPDARTIDRD